MLERFPKLNVAGSIPVSRSKRISSLLILASISPGKLASHAENALHVNSQGGFEMTKPTIVLVHGFWGGAAHWSKVIPRLNKKGYTSIFAVENPLTSLADDAERT